MPNCNRYQTTRTSWRWRRALLMMMMIPILERTWARNLSLLAGTPARLVKTVQRSRAWAVDARETYSSRRHSKAASEVMMKGCP